MKRVLILEDNVKTRECLMRIVKDINPKVEVCTVGSIGEAYQYMMEQLISVFIIDIIIDAHVPGDTSGLYFAEKVRSLDQYLFTPIIFITSLEDSKCMAYEKFHCYRFIEKPFDMRQVRKVVAECLKYPESVEKDKQLYFRKEGIILTINVKEIVWIESINHELVIHTVKGDVLRIPYYSIGKILKLADSNKLIQCSRNTVVNSSFITAIDLSNRYIFLKNGQQVEIGVTFKNTLRKKITC